MEILENNTREVNTSIYTNIEYVVMKLIKCIVNLMEGGRGSELTDRIFDPNDWGLMPATQC